MSNEIEFAPMTPKMIGDALGYDAKTIRRVMRSLTDSENQPGSGGRWLIESQADFDDIAARLRTTHHRKLVTFKSKNVVTESE